MSTKDNYSGTLEEAPVKVKQKVAFVIDALKVGGAEKFLISLVNSLSREGVEPWVVLLSNYNPLLDELDRSVKVSVFARRFKYDLSVSKHIGALLKRERIRKVLCVDPFSFFIARWSFLFDKSISVYLSLHHTLPTSFKYYILNFVYLRFIGSRDSLIYICQNQKNYFEKTYKVKGLRSEVIYNGIDTEYFSAERANQEIDPAELSWKARLGLEPESKVILKVASLRSEKRHNRAIEALGVLHSRFKNHAHLVFVGVKPSDEPYLQELKSIALANRVGDFVHFVPMQADVRPYLMQANIFTLTSRSVETFSLSALEAMSFGLPCSLTKIGGAAEMVEEGKTGSLSTPENTLSIAESWHKLLTQSYNKEYIRKKVAEHFSIDKMVSQYKKLLVR